MGEFESEENIKDIGAIINAKLKTTLKKNALSSQLISGVVKRTCTTKDKKLTIEMCNVYLKSKIEYC